MGGSTITLGRMRGMALVGAVALALTAGCGGASAGDGAEVKIGLPHPLTGVWAEGGKNSLNGARLAIQDINAQGGIKALDGANLAAVEADTSSEDPGQSASVTRQLVQQDQVNALVGSYVSALTLTASTEAEKAGVPMLTQSYTDELTARGYKTLFQLPPTSTKLGESTVPYVSEAFAASGVDLERVAVISSNDAALKAQAEGTAASAEAEGLDVTATQFYPIDMTDASLLVQKVARTDPQLIFLGGPTQAATLVVQTLRDVGYEGPIVGLGGGGILNKGFANALGEDVTGVLSLSAWNWDMPYGGVEEINKRYSEKFDEPFMPQEAGESYTAIWVIKEAIERAGSSEPEDITQALREMTMKSGPASLMPGGEVDFDDTGLNAEVLPIMIQWQEGLPVTVWPKEVQQAEPVS